MMKPDSLLDAVERMYLSPRCCYRVIEIFYNISKEKNEGYRIKVSMNVYIAICKAISHLLTIFMFKQFWAVRNQELSISPFYR